MRDAMNLVYLYDGTLEGFLCCVYESYVRRETPTDIRTQNSQAAILEETEWIRTDLEHAQKVYVSLDKRICLEAQDFLRQAFLTNEPEREILMYRFIRLGYHYGRTVFDRLTDETIFSLNKAVLNLRREAHNYKGFLRFTAYDNVLVACISPKNRVLPLISDHFSDRFPDETFLIYDKTHKMALVHKPDGMILTSLDKLVLPQIDDAEKAYRSLWRCFQTTIAIEERKNPKCQMNHMPRRFWDEMTEFMTD